MSTYGQEQRDKENADLVKGVWSDSYRFAEIMKKYNGAPVCGRVMLAAFAQLEEETRWLA